MSFDQAQEIVTDPAQVATRSFLPFIGYTDVKRRFRTKKYADDPRPRRKRDRIVSEKERLLKYCSHTDGYIHSYYALKLSVIYENYIGSHDFSHSILGYRRGLGTNINMAKSAFDEIESRGACCVIGLDIKSFFDSIDHVVLKKNLLTLLNCSRLSPDWFSVFKSMTKFSWVNMKDIGAALGYASRRLPKPICCIDDFRLKIRGGKFVYSNKNAWGIPQGSPISSVFSNVYMIDFDRSVYIYLKSIGASYRRYSDDILIICDTSQYTEIIAFVEEQLAALGSSISISQDKTEISTFTISGNGLIADRPVKYLGFTYDGSRARVRDSTISRYYRRMTYRARKSAKAAAKKGAVNVFKRKLLKDFSHRGHSNLYSYVRRAAEIIEDNAPKRQLRRHMTILMRKIERFGK